MIADALNEVGAARSIVIDETNTVLAGNGVLEGAAQAGIENVLIVDADGDTIVAVRRSNLSPRQKKRLAFYDNRTAELAEWEPSVLAASADLLAGLFTADELTALLKEKEENYSRKVESPVYTPKGERPGIDQLYDESRTNRLLNAIDKADFLTDDERDFLTLAARRHTVFHYRKIAEFYAHASPDLQRLMEDSALIIIDFQRAIELGYVHLVERLAEQYGVDYPDA